MKTSGTPDVTLMEDHNVASDSASRSNLNKEVRKGRERERERERRGKIYSPDLDRIRRLKGHFFQLKIQCFSFGEVLDETVLS